MKLVINLLICLLFQLNLSQPLIKDISPRIYYSGETVTFKVTFINTDDVPTGDDLNWMYILGTDPKRKDFGTCSASEALVTCSKVAIVTETSLIEIQVSNAKLDLFTVVILTGQAITAFSTLPSAGDKVPFTVLFKLDYDLAPLISLHRGGIILEGSDCQLAATDKTRVKCLFDNLTKGIYSIYYNGVDSTKTVSTESDATPISLSPTMYYKGETVTIRFTYENEADVPTDKQLSNSKVLPFAKCDRNGLVLTCTDFMINNSSSEVEISTHPTLRYICTLPLLVEQRITSIAPSTIHQGAAAKEVTLTFLLQYDLIPIIELRKNDQIVAALDCSMDSTPGNVLRCTYAFTEKGLFYVFYNRVKSGKTITVEDASKPIMSPMIYFKGETVDFTFTYGDLTRIPDDVNLVYEDNQAFGHCTREPTYGISCKGVNVNNIEGLITITSKSTPSVTISELTILTGQSLLSIFPNSFLKDQLISARFTFLIENDVMPLLIDQFTGVALTGCELTTTPGNVVKCTIAMTQIGKHGIIYNGIDSEMAITVTDPSVPVISPSKYYRGETVDFTFTFVDKARMPENVKLKYKSNRLFGECSKGGTAIFCGGVKVNYDGPITITNSASPPVTIGELFILFGQMISLILPNEIGKGLKTEVKLTFALAYDVVPITVVRHKQKAINARTACKLASPPPTFHVKCSIECEALGEYSVIFNGITSKMTITVKDYYIPSFSPVKYYKGETVDFKFTYRDTAYIPVNVDLKYSKNGMDISFGKCSRWLQGIKCTGVQVKDEGPITIINSASPPLELATLTVLTGQRLLAFSPISVRRSTETEVILTFAEEYDVEPVIQAKSASSTKEASSCFISSDIKTKVVCLWTIDTVDQYLIISNGVMSTTYLEVSQGKRLMLSFSLMLFALLI